MFHWELCKNLKFDYSNKWCMHNTEPVLENKRQKSPLGFLETNGSPNFSQTTEPYYNKKKRSYCVIDFAVPTGRRVKLKESEKKHFYLDLARGLKKMWDMKVTLISFLIGAPGTVTKELVHGMGDLEIRRQVETIQTTALLRSTRIMRRLLATLRG